MLYLLLHAIREYYCRYMTEREREREKERERAERERDRET
jgi:hypothetical protein